MARLGFDVAPPTGRSLDRIRNFLAESLFARLPALEGVKAVDHPWPADLDPGSVPWRARTRNRLINGGVLDQPGKLSDLTLGELSRIPQLGPIGILDCLATLEAAEVHLASRTGIPAMPGDTGELIAPRSPDGAEVLLAALDCDWIDKVSREDPRFAKLLPPIQGTVFDAIDGLTSGVRTDSEAVGVVGALAAAIPSVQAEAERIAALPIEEALKELVAELLGSQDARVDALLERLNWSGKAHRVTLEEAGRVAAITRERVRQLEKRIKERVADRRLYLPQLDRAMRVLAEHAPMDASDAGRMLLEHGLSNSAFHPRSLLAVAAAMNRTPLVQVEGRRGREAVVRESISAAADSIIDVTFRQLSHVGTTNVEAVSSELATHGVVVSDDEVEQILRLYAEAVFTVGSWFWCPSRPHSNLVTQARKVLSVVSPVEAGSLREGIRRAFQFRQSSGRTRRLLLVPTKAALLEYLRGHPDFVVGAEGGVRYVRPLDHRKELPPSEQIMVQVLGESPAGVLDRSSFRDACISRGLNRNTFSVLTSYSPVLSSLGYGLWTLRGRRVDPAATETLRQMSNERPPERRVVDHGWTSEGRLWVAIRLPDDPCSVLPHVPSAVVRYLTSPEYVARTAGNVECGRVRIYENGNSSGYAPFLRQAGADEGDILVAEFDLMSASVSLHLAGEEDLERLEGAA
jgi:hypothetical protein